MIYIGITIGPIVDTIMQTSSPAGLWFASYVYSQLSYQLCVTIDGEFGGDTDYQLLIPHLDKTYKSHGVGAYPDHIIFRVSAETNDMRSRLNQIINQCKREMVDDILDAIEKNTDDAKCDLCNYLTVDSFLVDKSKINGSVLAHFNPLFDAVERDNYNTLGSGKFLLKQLFEGPAAERINEYIKKTKLYRSLEKDTQFQLINHKNNQIRNLEHIARFDHSKLKANKYFAIVQVDGDNFGKLISNLDESDITIFSKKSLVFSGEAAKLIGDYGGLTIYIGGDDLLFLAPLKGKNPESQEGKNPESQDGLITLFDLLCLLDVKFATCFSELTDKGSTISLSFGVQMNYYKFPLYEGLGNAIYLLFDRAKAQKNCKSLQLCKHSGQTINLLIKNGGVIENHLVDLLNYSNADAEVVQSILYHIENLATLFDVAFGSPEVEPIDNFFRNVFKQYGKFKDGVWQDYTHGYVAAIANFVTAAWRQNQKFAGQQLTRDDLTTLLRLVKFYTEQGDA